jgi:hypothetical protein
MRKPEIKLTTGQVISTNFYRNNMWINDYPFPYSDDDAILLIYATTSKFTRITCYPIRTKEIWKFSIKLNTINPQLADQVGAIFKRTNLIHTTGICEEHSLFQIENYISADNNEKHGEIICHELNEIPEIDHVDFSIIRQTK